jgi:D-alanyl-D-alanine carboxypeptidase
MPRPLLGVIALALIALGAPSATESAPPSARTILTETVTALVADGSPGALAVVRTPGRTDRAVAGLARIKPQVPLRSSDRFRVASLTKTFVATVVLQLAAEQKLTLDDSVEKWLPGLVPNGSAITLRQLLNHTSGLFDYDSDRDWQAARLAKPGRIWSPRELVKIATSHPPVFAPGAGWSYSNTNYILLGLVVEAVTDKSLASELQRRLFRRLALRSTSYPTKTAMRGRFVHGYFVSRAPIPGPRGTLIDVSSLLSPSAWGAGQIVSNADDLVTFLRALLGGRLLPAALLKEMKTSLPGPALYDYGLGLMIFDSACGKAYGHIGAFPGYRTVAVASADGKRVAVVMINIDIEAATNRLVADAQDVFCFG